MEAASVLVYLTSLFCYAVFAKDLSTHFEALFPKLSDDVAAQVGRSTVIPFSWSGSNSFQIQHYLNNATAKHFVYINGKSVLGDGFTVHQNKTGRYELVIDTLRHDHAGIYDLIVGESVASKRCLTVVSGFSCSADRSSNRHEAYYHCSVQHTGPAQPIMDWLELGECSETDTSSTYDSAGLNIRKSSCMVAVPQSNEYMLRHSKTCTLSFIDFDRLKLHQTFTCSTIMPQTTTYVYQWSFASDRMYLRLGHIMYLILLGLFVFIIYCVRNPFLWMLVRLQKWCNDWPLFRDVNSTNGMKRESIELNSGLQVIDS